MRLLGSMAMACADGERLPVDGGVLVCRGGCYVSADGAGGGGSGGGGGAGPCAGSADADACWSCCDAMANDAFLLVYECTCANGGVPCAGICEGTACGEGPVSGECMACLQTHLTADDPCTSRNTGPSVGKQLG